MSLFGSSLCWLDHNPSVQYSIVQVRLPRVVIRTPRPSAWPVLPAFWPLQGRSWGGQWTIDAELVETQSVFGIVHLLGAPVWQDTRRAPRYPLVVPCRMDSAAGAFWGMTRNCSYQTLAWSVAPDIPAPSPGETVHWTLRHIAQEFEGSGICVRTQTTSTETLIVVRIRDAVSTQHLAQILALQGQGEA